MLIELADEDYDDFGLECLADGLWAESLFAGNPPSLMQHDDRAMWLRLAKAFDRDHRIAAAARKWAKLNKRCREDENVTTDIEAARDRAEDYLNELVEANNE